MADTDDISPTEGPVTQGDAALDALSRSEDAAAYIEQRQDDLRQEAGLEPETPADERESRIEQALRRARQDTADARKPNGNGLSLDQQYQAAEQEYQQQQAAEAQAAQQQAGVAFSDGVLTSLANGSISEISRVMRSTRSGRPADLAIATANQRFGLACAGASRQTCQACAVDLRAGSWSNAALPITPRSKWASRPRAASISASASPKWEKSQMTFQLNPGGLTLRVVGLDGVIGSARGGLLTSVEKRALTGPPWAWL
jgi:hypothetical protein